MLLRLLLVGAVTSLGLDAPSVLHFGCCGSRCPDGATRAAATLPADSPWAEVLAAIDDGEADDDLDFTTVPVILTATAPVGDPAPAPEEADAPFLAVVDAMAGTFVEPAPAPAPIAPATVLAWEPADVPDQTETGLPYTLENLAGEPEEAPAVAATEGVIDSGWRAADPSKASVRLIVAVRLTGRAVSAWMNFLRPGQSSLSIRE
jgi:hypothetical protein